MNDILLRCKDSLVTLFKRIDGFLQTAGIRKTGFGFIVLTSFILILVLNRLQPLFGDDWSYSLMPDGQTRISTISDIVSTLYKHYFDWGGRIVVHIIAESLLIADEYTGDIINSLAYVIFTLIIYNIANYKNIVRPSLLIFINFLIFFFTPAFGSTILWITGSANYLWGTLIIISFLIPFVRYTFSKKTKDNYLKTLLFFIGGIIAGWTNENMAVALIFMLIVFILHYKYTTGTIPQWAIAGLTGSIIGAILMIIAPGNYARMGTIIASQYSEQSTLSLFFSRFIGTLSSFYYYCLIPTFIFLVTLWLYYPFGKKQYKKEVIFVSFLFMAGAIVGTLAMSASPIFPGRASFGINSLIFIATCILFANLEFNTTLIKRLTYTTLIFGLSLFVVDYYRAFRTMNILDNHLKTRMEVIDRHKKNNNKDIVLEDRIIALPNSRFIHFYELASDSSDWHNRIFSGYYNLNSIIIK